MRRASQTYARPASYFVAAVAFVAAPAAAQTGAVVSAYSQDMFRGYSVSAGHPVAILDLSYDDPGGAYAAVSASGMAGPNSPRPLRLELNGGYARRLRSGLSLDAGIVASRYSRYANTGGGRSYAEIYAGVSGKLIATRLSFSPHYFGAHARTLYGEINGHLPIGYRLSVDAHGGLLVALRGYDENYSSPRRQHDWRVGVTRDVGRFALHAAWAGGGPGRDYYGGDDHRRSALILGASLIL